MSSSSVVGLFNKIGSEWTIAWATIALVLVTAFFMYLQLRAAKKQMRVELLLKNRDRYDEFVMENKRKYLAIQIKKAKADRKEITEIPEGIINFFEDLGLQLKHGYLEADMVWDIFGYDIVHWWCVQEEYMFHQREIYKDDGFYSNFEWLAKHLIKKHSHPLPTKAEMNSFLDDQQNLIP